MFDDIRIYLMVGFIRHTRGMTHFKKKSALCIFAFGGVAKDAANQIIRHHNNRDLMPLQHSCKDRLVICLRSPGIQIAKASTMTVNPKSPAYNSKTK